MKIQIPFGGKLKRLVGNDTIQTSYILVPNVRKFYKAEEQGLVSRRFWKNIFMISNENINLCPDTEEMAPQQFQPSDKIYFNKFSSESHLTTPITTEVYHVINKFKNKATGQSKISEAVLNNLPKNMIEYFRHAASASGYCPSKFKTQTHPQSRILTDRNSKLQTNIPTGNIRKNIGKE